VDRFAVAAIETGNVRPHVLDADGEQNAPCLDGGAAAKLDREQLSCLVDRPVDDSVDEGDSELRTLVAADRAKIGRPNALVSEISVDSPRFPVARVSGINDDHCMQVSREP
jgi:hypothetical protein